MDEQQDHESLGIVGWDAFYFFVNDLERSRGFYTAKMAVPEVARLDSRRAAESAEDASLFALGKAQVVCVAPRTVTSRAGRFLARHPDGVAILGFRVRSIEETRRILGERDATFVTAVISEPDHQGRPYRYFDIATPLADVRFRFVERLSGALPPGFAAHGDPNDGNPFGFQAIDHVTSNLLCLEPFVTWLRDVLGFSEYWRVRFHSSDVRPGNGGSGLASIVMWDAESGVKLANNEPLAPNFEASQIFTFVEANHGAGVQHLAFHVPAIIPAVEGLCERGIPFLAPPASYYDMLPGRFVQRRVTNFVEKFDTMRRLGILVDGEDDRYLLQIFMLEGGLLYGDANAGPFFYEVIQRRGARGFGEGNFRALFDAIERDQVARGLVQQQWAAGAGS